MDDLSYEVRPLDHSRSGDPEHCCNPRADLHRFHFRLDAPRNPDNMISCCCKSVTTSVRHLLSVTSVP